MSHPHSRTPLLTPISQAEAGPFRYDLLHMLNTTADPFAAVTYRARIDLIRQRIAALCAAGAAGVNLTHAINKLLATAIDANPAFNQIVCGSRLYRVNGIHIANALLLPGDEHALTNIIISDAHEKPLSTIAADFARLKKLRQQQYASGTLTGNRWLRRYFRLRLYRLIPERLLFIAGLRSGMASNIVLSNHWYGENASFTVIKPVQTPTKVALRMHTSLATMPVAADDRVITRETLRITLILDHRVVHGVHAQQFGRTLEALAARPESWLV